MKRSMMDAMAAMIAAATIPPTRRGPGQRRIEGSAVHNAGTLVLHDRRAELAKARERYAKRPSRKNRRRVILAERRLAYSPQAVLR
jgi:hypothetical protein